MRVLVKTSTKKYATICYKEGYVIVKQIKVKITRSTNCVTERATDGSYTFERRVVAKPKGYTAWKLVENESSI